MNYDVNEIGIAAKKFIEKMKPGLEKKRNLFTEGIMNLSTEDIRFLENESGDEKISSIVLLICLLIEIYPKPEGKIDEKKVKEMFEFFNFLLPLASLVKHNLIEVTGGSNKLLSTKKTLKIRCLPLESPINFIEQNCNSPRNI